MRVYGYVLSKWSSINGKIQIFPDYIFTAYCIVQESPYDPSSPLVSPFPSPIILNLNNNLSLPPHPKVCSARIPQTALTRVIIVLASHHSLARRPVTINLRLEFRILLRCESQRFLAVSALQRVVSRGLVRWPKSDFAAISTNIIAAGFRPVE